MSDEPKDPRTESLKSILDNLVRACEDYIADIQNQENTLGYVAEAERQLAEDLKLSIAQYKKELAKE